MTFLGFWLQVTAYAGLLMLVYYIVLRNADTHRLSRGYLLLAAVLPLVLPFVAISGFFPSASNTTPIVWLQDIVVSGAKGLERAATVSLSLWQGYFLVCLVMLAVFIIRIMKLSKRLSQLKLTHRNGVNIAYNAPYTGSWLNYLLLEHGADDAAIIAHESAHIALRHSYDFLFLNLLCCFSWINPFLFLLRRELRTVHEFQADEAATQGSDKAMYIELMLQKIFQTDNHFFIHTFFQHPIKRRIMMLHNRNRKGNGSLRVLLAASLILLVSGTGVFIQSCSNDKSSALEPSNATPAERLERIETVHNDDGTVDSIEVSSPVFDNADVNPSFKGDLLAYLSQNIHYPEEAKEKGIEGKVIVKFIVSSDGKINFPKVVRNPNQQLADEALRVIKAMPDWEPGIKDGQPVNVYFLQPITFKLK